MSAPMNLMFPLKSGDHMQVLDSKDTETTLSSNEFAIVGKNER